MEDQQKSRLLIMGLAGIVLVGAGWYVMQQNNNAAEKAEQASGTPQNNAVAKPATAVTNSPAGSAEKPAITANTTATTTVPATPVNPATVPGSNNPPGTPKALGLAGAMDPDSSGPATSSTSTTTSTVASSTLPPAGPAATPVIAASPEPVRSTPAGKYPSTKRDEAASTAHQIAGRQDPMQGAFEKVPYPAPWSRAGSGGGRTSQDDEQDADREKNKLEGKDKLADKVLPPPPPPTKSERPVPPPPPSVVEAPSLPIDNLPQPPDKPLVSPSLKLTGILGNKAVLTVPLLLRTQNKWPSVICLGPGEKFEDPTNGSFSVVSVDQDSVTIDEEGERSVKSLPQIK